VADVQPITEADVRATESRELCLCEDN